MTALLAAHKPANLKLTQLWLDNLQSLQGNKGFCTKSAVVHAKRLSGRVTNASYICTLSTLRTSIHMLQNREGGEAL